MRNTKPSPHTMFITTVHRPALLTTILFLVCSITGFSQNPTKADVNKKEMVSSEKKITVQPDGCKFIKTEVDKANGKTVKMMDREKIVGYTPEEMKKIFKDSDFITMEAYLNNFNNSIALLLKITIQTNDPNTTYGSIYKEAKLLLKLANGETITLLSGQSDAGNVDFSNIRTNYMTFFPLDEATLEKLKSSEVTKARLFWAKGYEDYTMKVPDFFIRQIACVK